MLSEHTRVSDGQPDPVRRAFDPEDRKRRGTERASGFTVRRAISGIRWLLNCGLAVQAMICRPFCFAVVSKGCVLLGHPPSPARIKYELSQGADIAIASTSSSVSS